MSLTLETVKAGDKVIMWYSGFSPTATLENVSRVTKTQIHVAGRIFRHNGTEVSGGSWSSHYIEPCTPKNMVNYNENQQERKQKEASTWLRNFAWNTLTLDQLESIIVQIKGANYD